MPVARRPVKDAPSVSGQSRTQRWLPRHDIFAEAVVAGSTIKDAFILASGSKGTGGGTQTAQKWLNWPPMIERIALLRAERLNRLALDRDQVIFNLMDTYTAATAPISTWPRCGRWIRSRNCSTSTRPTNSSLR